MSRLLTTDEIYAMAVEIEDNAVRFYERAAEKHQDKREFLERMASMEGGHKQVFEQMRAAAREMAAAGRDPLGPEGALYIDAIGSGVRIEGSPRVADEITGEESIEDILRMAIDLEKQSVLFYLGLKGNLGPDYDATLDEIIEEERSHLTMLGSELRALT